jgi:molybdopterin converting factor small subunit
VDQELTLLYFAEVARRTGTREESIPFREGATLSELQEELFEKYPQLKAMSQHLLWSVDEEIAGGETRLFASQRVGVMPPFSGG